MSFIVRKLFAVVLFGALALGCGTPPQQESEPPREPAELRGVVNVAGRPLTHYHLKAFTPTNQLLGEVEADAAGTFAMALTGKAQASDVIVQVSMGEMELGHYRVPSSAAIQIEIADQELMSIDRLPGPVGGETRLVINDYVCTLYKWGEVMLTTKGRNDKFRHCYANCSAVRSCRLVGAGTSAGISIVKEAFDQVCYWLPNVWPITALKDWLDASGISKCTGWDSADLAADAYGQYCAIRGTDCNTCCSSSYP